MMLQKTFTEYELQKMAVKLKASLKDKTYVLNSIDFEAAFQCIAHKGYLTNDETNKISTIIKNSWSDYRHFPSYEEICCASALAASDYLTNVKWMWLKNMTIPNTVNVDITHIARLAFIVEEGVHLDNVTGDKTLLLKSICSKELKLSNIELNHLETRYVVQCLQSSIDVVHLGSSDGPEIVLDFQTFKEYDGNGKCHKILCYSDTCDAQLIHQLKAWATDVNWEMKMGKYIAFKRPPQNSIMQNKLKEMAMKLQSSLRDDSHDLTSMDYEAGFQLIMKGGYLSEHEVNLISNKIQSSWSNHRHYPSNAEVFCAAALATTGNLANVQWMWLNNMEIPKTNVIDITHYYKIGCKCYRRSSS